MVHFFWNRSPQLFLEFFCGIPLNFSSSCEFFSSENLGVNIIRISENLLGDRSNRSLSQFTLTYLSVNILQDLTIGFFSSVFYVHFPQQVSVQRSSVFSTNTEVNKSNVFIFNWNSLRLKIEGLVLWMKVKTILHIRRLLKNVFSYGLLFFLLLMIVISKKPIQN